MWSSSEGEAGLKEEPVEGRIRHRARRMAVFALERRQTGYVIANAHRRTRQVIHHRRGLAADSEQYVTRVYVRPLEPVIGLPLAPYSRQPVRNLRIGRVAVELSLSHRVAVTNVRKLRQKLRSFLRPNDMCRRDEFLEPGIAGQRRRRRNGVAINRSAHLQAVQRRRSLARWQHRYSSLFLFAAVRQAFRAFQSERASLASPARARLLPHSEIEHLTATVEIPRRSPIHDAYSPPGTSFILALLLHEFPASSPPIPRPLVPFSSLYILLFLLHSAS